MEREPKTTCPRVAAVVLNYNGMQWLDRCFATLLDCDYSNLVVYMVDNASTDESVAWMQREYPSVCIIKNTENLGWSGGNNVGIKRALQEGTDWVWLLNSDIEMEPDCLSEMIKYAEQHADVRLLNPVINYFEPRDKIWFCGGILDYAAAEVIHFGSVDDFKNSNGARILSGCALLIHKDVFGMIGLIDEKFHFYSEDWDYCIRADAKGFCMDIVDTARMYHKVHGATGGMGIQTPWTTYQMFRSNLIFYRRHLGFWRFHREYCSRYLFKWVGVRYADEALADAAYDALWYFITFRRCPRKWPESPAWFRAFMKTRGWVFIMLLSFRLPWVANVQNERGV